MDEWRKCSRPISYQLLKRLLTFPDSQHFELLQKGMLVAITPGPLPQTLYPCHAIPCVCVCVCVCVHQMIGFNNLRGPFRSEGRWRIQTLNLSLHYASRHIISLHSLPLNLRWVTWLGADRHYSASSGPCQGLPQGSTSGTSPCWVWSART